MCHFKNIELFNSQPGDVKTNLILNREHFYYHRLSYLIKSSTPAINAYYHYVCFLSVNQLNGHRGLSLDD